MTNPSRSYRQLPEWQHAMDLAVLVFNESKHLEEDDHVLIEDLQRAAMRVATRIAAGWDENDHFEFRKYLRRATGGLYHLMTVAELCERLERTGDWNKIIVDATDLRSEIEALIARLGKSEG